MNSISAGRTGGRVILWWLIVTTATLIVASGLGGCSMGQKAQYTRTIDLLVPHQAATGVDVRSRNGSIEVLAAEPGVRFTTSGNGIGGQGVERAGPANGPSEVAVRAVISAVSSERAQATALIAERDAGGVLRVRVEWPQGRPESSEGAAITVRAPDVLGVWAQTSNGSIELRNISGAAELDTSNGVIRVGTHAGDVNASTSNGAIEMFDVSGAVDAASSNGPIDLIDIGGRAFAETSNGNVLVQLSRRSRGPCIVETSNGRAELIVGPGFRGELACETSNGKIVTDLPHADISRLEPTHVVLMVGSEGGRSRVSTSNGGIRVTYVGEPQIELPVRSEAFPEVVVRPGLVAQSRSGVGAAPSPRRP